MNYFEDLRAARAKPGSARPDNVSRRRVVSDIVPPSRRVPPPPPRGDAETRTPETSRTKRPDGGPTLRMLEPRMPAAKAPGREPIHPPTFSRDIVLREKDLKPPLIAAARPRGIREGGGIKPKEPARAGDLDLPVRTWEPERIRKNRRLRWTIVLAGGSALTIAVLALTFVTPRFSITVTPKVERVAVPPTELTADTAATTVDPSRKRLPGMSVEVEKGVSGEYETSGTKVFQDRARGTVQISNAFSSSPQPLIANTRLQDSTGKIFRLQNALTIPGARVADGKIIPTSLAAEVIADQPGEAYNIGPTEFRIPGFRGTARYDGFYARSDASFSGGFQGEARVVTAADIARASEELTKRLVEELNAELKSKIPPDTDFIVPDGGREVSVQNIEAPSAGARFDRFGAKAAGRGRMILIRRSQVLDALAGILLPATDGLLRRVARESSDIGVSQGRDVSGGELRFVAGGTLTHWLEPSVDELARTLRTSTPRKAEAYLRGREEIASFEIKRFPRWIWFIPRRSSGLTVTVAAPR